MDVPENPPVPIAPPPGLAARGSQDHPQIPGNPKAGIPLPRITERDLLEAGAVDDVAAAGVQMAGHHRMRPVPDVPVLGGGRSEEHTSELQSLMRISYAVFCLKKKHKIIHYIMSKSRNTIHVQ